MNNNKEKSLEYSNSRSDGVYFGSRFLRFVDSLNKLITHLCGIAMFIMVFCIGLGILNRFLFSHSSLSFSMPWTEEVTRYLMTWVVFLGAAVATREDKLIGLQFIIYAVPRTLGSGIKHLSILMSMAFYLTLVWVGLEWAELGQSQGSPVLKLPMVTVYSSMSLGFALCILNTLALLYEAHKFKGGILETREGDPESNVILEEVIK